MSSQPTSHPEQPEDPQFDRIHELHERYEPLRAELHECLKETRFGYFIQHRFCNMPVPDLERCALIHHTIDERIAEADACFEVGDWAGWIRSHEIYSQPEWFAKDAHAILTISTGGYSPRSISSRSTRIIIGISSTSVFAPDAPGERI